MTEEIMNKDIKQRINQTLVEIAEHIKKGDCCSWNNCLNCITNEIINQYDVTYYPEYSNREGKIMDVMRTILSNTHRLEQVASEGVFINDVNVYKDKQQLKKEELIFLLNLKDKEIRKILFKLKLYDTPLVVKERIVVND
jgi:transcription initiation factor IIE alpha subunit